MTEEKLDLKELIKYIDPAACTYSEWVEVGMALKYEGYSCDDWDEWSRPDKRYHAGDCEKKWNTFNGAAAPVRRGLSFRWQKITAGIFRQMTARLTGTALSENIRMILFLSTKAGLKARS